MSRKLLILSFALTLCMAAWAKPSSGLSETTLDSEDTFDDMELAPRIDLGDIASIAFTVKDTIRDVVVEIGIQIFKFVVKCLWNLKVNLLRKLAPFSLSDVLGSVLDGVVALMAEASGASSYASGPVKYEYDAPYGSLAPLLRSAA